MNQHSLFLLLLLSVIYYASYSQINDSFSDSDFLKDQAWHGDHNDFIVNAAGQLQLNAPGIADVSFLATESEIINNAEWSFYVKLDFNPSSNNFMDVYLVSDQMDLTSSLNGYFVRIGNTADEISLYRQTGDKSSSTKIIDGQDDRVDHSSVELRIKVTRDLAGEWELLVDMHLTDEFISEGTVKDDLIFYSRYFGVLCNYTSTRSDKFYFDEVSISGDAHTDTTAPKIDSLVVLSDSSLRLFFNEKMLLSGLLRTDNYFVDHGIGNPMEASIVSDSAVVLFFGQKFHDGVGMQISIHNLPDLFGNKLENLVMSFKYTAPYIIGYGDVIITEIMPDPTPGIDLPEYEYVEIYNPRDITLALDNVTLIVGKDSASIPNLTIAPGEYLILCQHAAVDKFESHGRTVKVANWPSLNNRGEAIILINTKNEIVHAQDYKDTWYRSIDKDDGGYSLEMIDTTKPCLGGENWIASSDPAGGTPGKQNASKAEITDLSAPEIEQIIAISDSAAIIYLSEGIGSQNIELHDISVKPEIEVRKTALQAPGFSSLLVEFHSSLKPNLIYELTLKNVVDCTGNVQHESSSTFVLPEAADSLDLIINEILFDPRPGGVDFVEIYNQSDKFIDMNSIFLGNDGLEIITTGHFMIHPGQFLVITEDALTLQNHYPTIDMENLLVSPDMPSFNNDQGNVYMENDAKTILDFFHYEDDFHSSFLQDREGVSLERISYESATNDPDNWQSASASVGYATPGAPNSQSLLGNDQGEEILIEPKVFVPGSNGFQNFTTIRCRFPAGGNMANILILDRSGKAVRTILSHKSIGVQDDFKWEGLDDQGRQVRMGPYIVHIEIYNTSGIKKLYRKKVVVGGEL